MKNVAHMCFFFNTKLIKKKKRIDIPNISQIIRIFSQKHKKHFYDKAGVR